MNEMNKMEAEDLRSHLMMIQNAISRMADESAAMKRYSIISVVTGLAAIRITNDPAIFILLIFLIFAFAFLDAKYHQQSLWFRSLYDEIRQRPRDAPVDFLMTPDVSHKEGHDFIESLKSWSVSGLYVSLSIVLFLAWVMAVKSSVI